MHRKHQAEFDWITDDIIAGAPINEIDVVATPGAGKSSLPIQAVKLIKAGLVDRIAWIVPRSALQNQGERGFMDPFFMKMFDCDLLIRASTNEFNPCRGTSGFVTTYQAISADKENTVIREVRSKRYIIFLDEFHHLEDDGVWHQAINAIVNSCKYVVKMTGTLGRGDKKPIAYINYRGSLPVFNTKESSRLILYTRTDGLREKAILPIQFHLNDGEFKWRDAKGNEKSVSSFKKALTPKQQTASLFTALNSEFFVQILRDCVIHWKHWKISHPTAKLLIVCADYDGAQRALDMLKRSVGTYALIATSHETENAIKSINKFKSSACDCLVTIAMAYEGLDVPEISHICTLTNISSREWIEQMIARAVRIDRAYPYEAQMAYVFAPMDKRLKKVVDLVKKEQVSAIEYFSNIKQEDDAQDLLEGEVVEEDLFPEMAEALPGIEPISSRLTDKSKLLLGELSIPGVVGVKPFRFAIVKTVREQETELRQEIHKHINIFCHNNSYRHQRINSEIKAKFNKQRDLMTLGELRNLRIYIIKYYPINGSVISSEGVSAQRKRQDRVSNKVKTWTTRSEIMDKMNMNPINDLL